MEALGLITIPLFSGIIGYATNWSGVWMLFQPLRFKGVRVPGLATLARLLPRKVQEIPGIMHGGLGWQGIIPSRAARAEGAQPAVDVRAAKVPLISSELVAPGLSMIGAGAGCRHVDRVPAYLNNLYRLGLIWFSREPLEDPLRYQVLEAQPEVLEAKRAAGRGAKTVRRQILLTPFGQDFCLVCLP